MTSDKIGKTIDRFVKLAEMHYSDTLKGDHKSANKRAKELQKIFQEIKTMGKPARIALLSNINDDRDEVAAMAAVYSLKFDTEKSLIALRRIADNPELIGFEAEQAIRRWEEGAWELE